MSVHEVEHDDLGNAIVRADHADFPKLRFTLGMTADGALGWFEVCDRRFDRRDPEPSPTSELWGPVVPITRRLLAALPLGELERAARARIGEDRSDAAAGEVDEAPDWLGELAPSPAPRRGGRPARSDLFYAKVAKRYVSALSAGPNPVRAVAASQDSGLTLPAARNTVKGWIAEARARGLLSEGPKSDGPIGKAGGRLTAKARAVLKEGRPHG